MGLFKKKKFTRFSFEGKTIFTTKKEAELFKRKGQKVVRVRSSKLITPFFTVKNTDKRR